MDNFIQINITDNHPEAPTINREDCIKQMKDGSVRLLDTEYAKLFIAGNHVRFSNGAFYSPDGMCFPSEMKHTIALGLSDTINQNIALYVDKVYNAIKYLTDEGEFRFQNRLIIPFKNGNLRVNLHGMWEFKEVHDDIQPVPYRLPVDFVPFHKNIPTPNFNKWINDLVEKEDIATIQEYLGYCLLPTTKVQKSLVLVGDGGLGKSILKKILSSIFGKALISPTDTSQFFQDKFSLSDLENKLVYYEDDLGDGNLENAGQFKKLVTNDDKIRAERKFENAYEFYPYARYIICGNDMFRAANDNSLGFYRRLLAIHCKPKNPNRKDDPDLGAKISKEAEGILQWILIGLKRVINNGWKVHESERSKDYLLQYIRQADHFPEFFKDAFEEDVESKITTNELVAAYNRWCVENGCTAVKDKVLKTYIINNGEKYHIYKCDNVYRDDNDGNRRHYRGYMGIRIKDEYAPKSINKIPI